MEDRYRLPHEHREEHSRSSTLYIWPLWLLIRVQTHPDVHTWLPTYCDFFIMMLYNPAGYQLL
jgi:hypothetical protein